jgi:hypothetical protein
MDDINDVSMLNDHGTTKFHVVSRQFFSYPGKCGGRDWTKQKNTAVVLAVKINFVRLSVGISHGSGPPFGDPFSGIAPDRG